MGVALGLDALGMVGRKEAPGQRWPQHACNMDQEPQHDQRLSRARQIRNPTKLPRQSSTNMVNGLQTSLGPMPASPVSLFPIRRFLGRGISQRRPWSSFRGRRANQGPRIKQSAP